MPVMLKVQSEELLGELPAGLVTWICVSGASVSTQNVATSRPLSESNGLKMQLYDWQYWTAITSYFPSARGAPFGSGGSRGLEKARPVMSDQGITNLPGEGRNCRASSSPWPTFHPKMSKMLSPSMC